MSSELVIDQTKIALIQGDITKQESLKLATEYNLASISFPSISTGAYGYPAKEASRVAINAVSSFLKAESTSIKEAVFVLFDPATYELYRSALEEISEAK
jgi:O-acetyl-ADP-ribose deacetylase (regulator of RNase III)